MRNCNKCGKPIILIPSAAERAKKDKFSGMTAKDYENLFPTCNECIVASWYNRPIVPYKKQGFTF